MKLNKYALLIFSSTAYLSSAQAQPKLEEVIVTSSRMEVPVRHIGAAVSVVGSEEIALRGYTSMADLLRTQPGIAVSNAGGAGKATALRIRGEEDYRTLVMIDGVDVSDPTATQVGPQVQHLRTGADIERIEILRGPQGFLYGADAGGVINIITRTADGFASEVVTEAGDLDTFNVQAFIAAGGERADGFVSVSEFATEGINSRTTDDSGEADGYENTTLHSKFGLQISPAWRLQLVARGTQARNEYDKCSGGNDCYDVFSQDIAKLSLGYKQQSYEHLFAVARTQMDRNNVASGQTSFSTDGSVDKIEYFGTAVLNPVFALAWGGDLENEQILANSGESGDRDQLGVFSELRASVDDAFFLSVGARFDDNEDFGKHVSARVAPAFIQELNGVSSIKYRASWGTGFRAPSLSELFYNRSDAAKVPAVDEVLAEETSEGYDVGVEFNSAEGYHLQLGYFDQKVENEIYFDLIAFSGYLQDEGVSHSRGGEVAFEIPVGALTVLGNYTYNDTLADDDQLRARRPRHLANLALAVALFDDRLRLFANARASRDAVIDVYKEGRQRLDDYEVADINLQYQPVAQLTLWARVENALAEQYEEITGFNTAGRTFYAGMKYSF